MKYKNIIIRGAYGTGNFGDDALMIAANQLVSSASPGSNIFFTVKDNSYVYQLKNNFNPASLPEELNEIDLELYGGGTQFFSLPRKFPYRGILRDIINGMKKRRILLTQSANYKRYTAKVRAAVGIGVGPFVENNRAELLSKKLLSSMDFISVRDALSYSICCNWGIQPLSKGTDLCFLPEFVLSHSLLNIKRELSNDKIGVIVRDWYHTKQSCNFQKTLLTVAEILQKKGFDVTFILFRKQDKQWYSLLSKQSVPALVWDPHKLQFDDFIKKLSEFKCILTMRYHGAIFSALHGIPFICIEIEPKLRAASELVPSLNNLWSKPFDAKDLLNIIDNILDNYHDKATQVKNMAEDHQHHANKMAVRFRQFINAG